MWKNLARLWPNLISNVQRVVGNGERVSFWKDKWVDDGRSLENGCLIQLNDEELMWKVKDMVDERGD